MYSIDFEYDGVSLSSLGYIICSFDGNSNGNVSAGTDIVFDTVRPTGSSKFRMYSSYYESAYTTTFSICKDTENLLIRESNDLYLSSEEISILNKWLCRKSFHKFKVYQDGYENIFWNGTFRTQQYILNGRTAGLTLTLITDAPFAYQEAELESSYQIYAVKNVPFDIYDCSDEEGYIYPNVTIKMLESGNLTLSNSMDNKITKISNCTSGEVITIDGENQIISSSLQSHIASDFNYYYPRVINIDGDNLNEFTSSLDCEITLSYNPIKKVGI